LLDLALRFVPYIRVQNGSDIVPSIPRIGYSHAGELLYLTNDGKLEINPGGLRRLRDRVFTGTQRLSDHAVQKSYLIDLLRVIRHEQQQV
jgi:hypothetical protein